MSLQMLQPTALTENVFDLIKLGMPLLTAEHAGTCNTMTVNWGQLGYLWNRCVATAYVRPQRYTFPLIDAAEGYSLCFMGTTYAAQTAYCGKASGRDEDKIAHCGFTVAHAHGIPYFEEAELVLLCKKTYSGWLTEHNFADPAVLESCYPKKDYHKMFIGEIIEVLAKK